MNCELIVSLRKPFHLVLVTKWRVYNITLTSLTLQLIAEITWTLRTYTYKQPSYRLGKVISCSSITDRFLIWLSGHGIDAIS